MKHFIIRESRCVCYRFENCRCVNFNEIPGFVFHITRTSSIAAYFDTRAFRCSDCGLYVTLSEMLFAALRYRRSVLQNVIPTNKPNVEAKRPSRPVNITPFVQQHREPDSTHKVLIEWTADRRAWAVAIFVVNRLTSEILMSVYNTFHPLLHL